MIKALGSVLVASCCTMALTACGGSSHKTASAATDPQLKMSECMRAHGVPNFPDPTKGSGGEGISVGMVPGSQTTTVGGIPFSGPVFAAAIKTCKFFGGGSSPPAITENQKLQQFHFAECMRKHGVPNYPDPVFPPGGGIERPNVSGLNLDSPAVRRAASACNGP
jgi:hypothetical protein